MPVMVLIMYCPAFMQSFNYIPIDAMTATLLAAPEGSGFPPLRDWRYCKDLNPVEKSTQLQTPNRIIHDQKTDAEVEKYQ